MAAEDGRAQPASLSFALFAWRGGRTCWPENPWRPSLAGNQSRVASWKASTQSQQSPNKQDAFLSARGFCPDVTRIACHRGDSCRSTWTVILKAQRTKKAHVKYEPSIPWNIRIPSQKHSHLVIKLWLLLAYLCNPSVIYHPSVFISWA